MAVARVALALLSTASAIRLHQAPSDESIVLTDDGPLPAWAVIPQEDEPVLVKRSKRGNPKERRRERSLRRSSFELEREAKEEVEARVAKAATNGSAPVVFFVGDSTMRHQYQTFCGVLVPNETVSHEKWKSEGTIHSCSSNLGYAVFMLSPDFKPDMVKLIMDNGHPAPNVAYFISAFHLLHLHPAFVMNEQKMDRLLGFKAKLRETLETSRRLAPRIGLTLMTPYSVCEQRYSKEWGEMISIAQRNFTEAVQPCLNVMDGKNFSKADVYEMCSKGFFTRAGSWWLRNLTLEAVSESADVVGGPASAVDAWAMTDGHCGQCPDGRHYYDYAWRELNTLLQNNRY